MKCKLFWVHLDQPFQFQSGPVIVLAVVLTNRSKHPQNWVNTDLFSPHGLKHFLQLDTELLDVVEDNAGL